jgi:hypothetical protein
MRRDAEDWAEKIGLEIQGYMGSGDFGEAYETTCGKVLKITSDKLEYVCADKIMGQENDFAVNVYKTEVLDNGNMAILQEKLETSPEDYCIESLYYELMDECERQGNPIHMLDKEDYDGRISHEAAKMSDDIWMAVSEYLSSGTNPNDMHSENMGLKSNGNFGLFDQQDKQLNIEND